MTIDVVHRLSIIFFAEFLSPINVSSLRYANLIFQALDITEMSFENTQLPTLSITYLTLPYDREKIAYSTVIKIFIIPK